MPQLNPSLFDFAQMYEHYRSYNIAPTGWRAVEKKAVEGSKVRRMVTTFMRHVAGIGKKGAKDTAPTTIIIDGSLNEEECDVITFYDGFQLEKDPVYAALLKTNRPLGPNRANPPVASGKLPWMNLGRWRYFASKPWLIPSQGQMITEPGAVKEDALTVTHEWKLGNFGFESNTANADGSFGQHIMAALSYAEAEVDANADIELESALSRKPSVVSVSWGIEYPAAWITFAEGIPTVSERSLNASMVDREAWWSSPASVSKATLASTPRSTPPSTKSAVKESRSDSAQRLSVFREHM